MSDPDFARAVKRESEKGVTLVRCSGCGQAAERETVTITGPDGSRRREVRIRCTRRRKRYLHDLHGQKGTPPCPIITEEVTPMGVFSDAIDGLSRSALADRVGVHHMKIVGMLRSDEAGNLDPTACLPAEVIAAATEMREELAGSPGQAEQLEQLAHRPGPRRQGSPAPRPGRAARAARAAGAPAAPASGPSPERDLFDWLRELERAAAEVSRLGGVKARALIAAVLDRGTDD